MRGLTAKVPCQWQTQARISFMTWRGITATECGSAPGALSSTDPQRSGSLRSVGVADSRKHRVDLLVVGAAQLMISIDASTVNLAVPKAQAALSISDSDRYWILTAYALPFGALLLLGGRVGDRFGRRRALVLSLLGFALSSGLGGSAQSPGWLFMARGFQGLCAAVIAPTILAVISEAFVTPRERARAFAFYGAISAAGAALGLLMGGWLVDVYGWRGALLADVPIAFGIAVGASRLQRRDRATGAGPRGLDLPGALLCIACLTLLLLGANRIARGRGANLTSLSMFAAGVTLAVTFVLWERRAKEPLLPLRLLAPGARLGAVVALLVGTMALWGVFFIMTYYFQSVAHYSALRTAFAFLPHPLAAIVSASITSKSLVRYQSRWLACFGYLFAATGVLALTQLGPDSSYAMHVLPAQLVISAGMGHAVVVLTSASLAQTGTGDSGVVSALVNATQQLGSALGISLLSGFAALLTSGPSPLRGGAAAMASPREFMSALYAAVAMFVLAGICAVWLMRERSGERGPAFAE